jgi:hypothetical protein
MTRQTAKNLRALRDSVRRNRARVAKKLSKSGKAPSPPVVHSAAKYYEALKQLADK